MSTSMTQRKVVRLDKLAAFVNANFGREFDIPFAIEIEQNTNERFGTRYAVNLCSPETAREPVKTLFRSKMVAAELVGKKFDQIESSIAEAGPGIELLGLVSWYWLISGDNITHREVGIQTATMAWDAWTLATALLDGSKNRELFERNDFICPGVSVNQHLLCETMPSHDRHQGQVWLKRRTTVHNDAVSIESRWTHLRQYTAAHGFLHEEKRTLTQITTPEQIPSSFEVVMKAMKYPFNP